MNWLFQEALCIWQHFFFLRMLEGWILSDKIILSRKVNIHKTVQFPKRSCQRLSQYFVCIASRIISWSDSFHLVPMLALQDTSQFFQLVLKLMGTRDSTPICTKGFGGSPLQFSHQAGSRGRAHQPAGAVAQQGQPTSLLSPEHTATVTTSKSIPPTSLR